MATPGATPLRRILAAALGAALLGSPAAAQLTVAGRDSGVAARRPSTAGPTVSLLDTAFPMPQLGRTRRVWIYLPPDYATSDRAYPVLYMHDGRNMFDDSTSDPAEWRVDEALDSLHAAGDRGAIVVAVDNAPWRRIYEYSPWWSRQVHQGGQGDAYVDFLAQTLKPWMDQRFRTCPGPGGTGIMGSSMGGLISLYAALKYPHVFGRAGVFSPSLWVSDSVFSMARRANPAVRPRLYFVSGGRESQRLIVRNQQRMIDTLAAAGWRVGTDLHASLPEDGRHAEWFWRREFPAAYRWLFADGDPCAAPAGPRR
ncbi:MAG TPA: alpha/beta hydrolase-fold protein [Longimicrobium sp.]|nr:alpha/beta hydrolase-fold protein [Longimicrobium sp.]